MKLDGGGSAPLIQSCSEARTSPMSPNVGSRRCNIVSLRWDAAYAKRMAEHAPSLQRSAQNLSTKGPSGQETFAVLARTAHPPPNELTGSLQPHAKHRLRT